MTIQQVWKKNGYLLVFPGFFVGLIILKEFVPLKYLIPLVAACLSCILLLQRKKEVVTKVEEKNSQENMDDLIKTLDTDKRERQKKKNDKRKEQKKSRDASKVTGSASENDSATSKGRHDTSNSEADDESEGESEEEEDSEQMLLQYASKQSNSKNKR